MPCLTETSDLKEEDTIVLKHIVDLAEEATQVTNTDVLGHLKTGNLIVTASGDRDFAVVHAENLGLILRDTDSPKTVVTPGSLVATECDTSDVSTIVARGELGQSTPTAANVEHLLALLEANLLANNSHLVVLKLLESLLLVNVGDDTGSVDHAWAKEPAVEVVAAVVVVSDLLLVWNMLARLNAVVGCIQKERTLRLGVDDHLGNHAEEEVLNQTESEAGLGPVMAPFEDLEQVAVELDLTIEVLLLEGLDGYLLLAIVGVTVLLLLECEVVFDVLARQPGLLVLAGRKLGGQPPEGTENGQTQEQGEENPCLETSAQLPGEPGGDTD